MEPKINLNRPKVDDTEIESRKDFDELVNKFKNESLEKARKDLHLKRLKKIIYSTVIAGFTVFCTVTYINSKSNQKNIVTLNSEKNTHIKRKETKKFINPISDKANITYNKYKINTKNGCTITHNKSKLTIPVNSFIKKNGEDVKGEIEIEYREMHNQAEILASGIPMTYDSAGIIYHFESAGMVDIKGNQNGEEIFIKPGKNICIEMASINESPKFNLYSLDTTTRKWNYKGKDKVSVTINSEIASNKSATDASKKINLVKIEKKIAAIEREKDSLKKLADSKINSLVKLNEPKKPKETSTTKKPFFLDIDIKEHPELKVYQNIAFVSGDENINYTKEFNEIIWTNAKLSEGTKKGENYTLDLYLRKRHEKLIVYPVLKGKNLETALKEYQKKFEEYQQVSKKQIEYVEKTKKELDIILSKYRSDLAKQILIKKFKEEERTLEANFDKIRFDKKIIRTFMVSSFGIWNTDRPCNLPSGEKTKFVLMNNDKVLTPYSFFLVDHNRNTLFTISEQTSSFFRYPKEGDFSICCELQGIIYVCNKEQFKNAKDVDNKKVFVLNVINPKVTCLLDLKKGLGLIN